MSFVIEGLFLPLGIGVLPFQVLLPDGDAVLLPALLPKLPILEPLVGEFAGAAGGLLAASFVLEAEACVCFLEGIGESLVIDFSLFMERS